MKARLLGVRPVIPAVIAVEVVALSALLTLPMPWWSVTAVAALVVLVTVRRRTPLGWVLALFAWRRRRRRVPLPVGAAVEVAHGAHLYGVRIADGQATTMIAVSGKAYPPTVLTGSSIGLTPNLLPLEALTGLLDQPGGLHLAGIDVVSSGYRVRRGTGYPALYSTLLADRPAAGRRTTHLVVRLDIARSTAGLTYRQSVGAAAAAATERIVDALLQDGVRAGALTARELDTAVTEAGAGLLRIGEATDDPAPVESWRAIRTHPGYLTSYYYSPEDITTTGLNQLWALRSDAVVLTVTLTKNRRRTDQRVMVSALVRVADPQMPAGPPALHLNTLPGDQCPAAIRSAAVTPVLRPLPQRPLYPDGLELPVGSSGVLVGTTLRGDLLLLSLTDPDQPTRITMHTSMPYTRQLLVRAAATGERIAIHTDHPARWASLEQPMIAVVDHRHPSEFVPSIIVSDRASGPPPAGLAATVIAIGQSGAMNSETEPAPDISFVQTSPSMVRIATAAFTTDVHIATFKAEQPFLGHAAELVSREP